MQGSDKVGRACFLGFCWQHYTGVECGPRLPKVLEGHLWRMLRANDGISPRLLANHIEHLSDSREYAWRYSTIRVEASVLVALLDCFHCRHPYPRLLLSRLCRRKGTFACPHTDVPDALRLGSHPRPPSVDRHHGDGLGALRCRLGEYSSRCGTRLRDPYSRHASIHCNLRRIASADRERHAVCRPNDCRRDPHRHRRGRRRGGSSSSCHFYTHRWCLPNC
mmetsp:Transcript_26055/g.79220  ORF Transcript_26055/g.79220 Transcript_26055/m.79220 type:complete len:221 (+) Transcript_26055:2868-3530(+)